MSLFLLRLHNCGFYVEAETVGDAIALWRTHLDEFYKGDTDEGNAHVWPDVVERLTNFPVIRAAEVPHADR